MGQLSRALKDKWKFTRRKGVWSSDVPSPEGIKGWFSTTVRKVMCGEKQEMKLRREAVAAG